MTKFVTKSRRCRRRCLTCGGPLQRKRRGRPRLFCSNKCRQRFYLKRKESRADPIRLLKDDLSSALRREALTGAVIEVLQKLGMMVPTQPERPKLRIIRGGAPDKHE